MEPIIIILGAAFAVPFAAMGRYFGKGRGAKWINTIRDPERINAAEILKFMSKLMYVLAAVFGGGTVLTGITGVDGFFYAGLLLSVLACIAAVIYMNVSARFRL